MKNMAKPLMAVGFLMVVGSGIWAYNLNHPSSELGGKSVGIKQVSDGKESVDKKIDFKEGEHFIKIDPIYGLPSNSVVEVLWYGCLHCYNMEKKVGSEEFKEKSKDWNFQQYHIAKKDGAMGFDFKVFSALVQMGLDKTVGKSYMKAIHENGLDRSNFAKFAKDNGISVETVNELSENDEAKFLFNFIEQFSERKGFEGVPSFVVNGKYIVNNKYDVADVTNYLIEKESKEKEEKAAKEQAVDSEPTSPVDDAEVK